MGDANGNPLGSISIENGVLAFHTDNDGEGRRPLEALYDIHDHIRSNGSAMITFAVYMAESEDSWGKGKTLPDALRQLRQALGKKPKQGQTRVTASTDGFAVSGFGWRTEGLCAQFWV